MDYYRKIEERDVWVTVLKPLVWDENEKGYRESDDFCSAFKFDEPPMMTAGEFIRDPSKKNDMKWFTTSDDAANAAFEKAKNKLTSNS